MVGYLVETGEKMGYAEWKPAVMKETGGEFLVMKVFRGQLIATA